MRFSDCNPTAVVFDDQLIFYDQPSRLLVHMVQNIVFS